MSVINRPFTSFRVFLSLHVPSSCVFFSLKVRGSERERVRVRENGDDYGAWSWAYGEVLWAWLTTPFLRGRGRPAHIEVSTDTLRNLSVLSKNVFV